MSTPTQPMPPTGVRTEISRFVAAVVAALDDLPEDDAAELTDGLEADLGEAWAAEGLSPAERFGSPESYAAELRAAAGLPPRAEHRTRRPSVGSALLRRRDELLANLRARPWWPQAVEYGRELRPAWWALRGVTLVGLAFFAVVVFLGAFPFLLAVLVFLPAAIWGAVASMRAGAADMHSHERSGRLLTLANLLVAITLVIAAFGFAAGQSSGPVYYGDPVDSGAGLTFNGETVGNVFAYDAQGKPISRFRLFDQAGRPLTVDEGMREGWDDTTGAHWTSRPDVGQGPPEWNLFPLLRATAAAPDPDTGESTGRPVEGPVAPPYAELPALPASSATPVPATPGS